MSNFNEANVTRSREGKFTGHLAKEPGFSLEGLSPHQQPAASQGPYFTWPERTEAEQQAAKQRILAREQAKAAESLMKAYPDVVAARFVDIGSRDLVAPNGARWPNPDYVDQAGTPYFARKSFELRDVLLADGTVADEDNQPQFTEDPTVDRLADTFSEHAAMEFDPEGDPFVHAPYPEPLYKHLVNNQHTWFHQLINDATPRPLDVDKWGVYIDTDKREPAEDVTPDEIAALGGRGATAMQAHADELIAAHGKEGAVRVMHEARRQNPGIGRELAMIDVIDASADRPAPSRWNPFRRS
ncbi:MAG TPA: hypothetical protein VF885_13280 [Arthrobacter sp.]